MPQFVSLNNQYPKRMQLRTRYLSHIVFLSLFTLLSKPGVFSQVSIGGVPASFNTALELPLGKVNIPTPDIRGFEALDLQMEKEGFPYRVAVNIDVDIDFCAEAEGSEVKGLNILRLAINVPAAKGLVLYYKSFKIPEGGKLYLYTPDQSFLLGGYTIENNRNEGAFASALTPGETIIIEYEHPGGELPEILISQIGYAYRDNLFPAVKGKGFGSSQWCEVNVNCPEGANWQDEKRGVARILIKINGGTFWCTGSLVNTTAQDLTPYILSADHCGQDASAIDLEQWIFYFNYEAASCADPSNEPSSGQMVGCSLVSSAGGSSGSLVGADFFLVLLDQAVPPTYIPYFNGWTRENIPSPSGVGIHHPAGDLKKISTYTAPTYSTQWGGTPNTHWGVEWVSTQTNHGVTEGGSSGSPLFDAQGRIIGVLSGGDAACNALSDDDLYGKISYAWDQGTTPDRRLSDWLDPLNTGTNSIGGSYGSTVYVVADFIADTTVIPLNSSIDFTDLSFGDPDSWEWTFTGGNPSVSEARNPQNIRYEQTGTFSVGLKVSNEFSSNENIKLAYIRVIPSIYPNPLFFDSPESRFKIDFGKRNIEGISMNMYNSIGQEVKFILSETGQQGMFYIDIREHSGGIYLLKVSTDEGTDGYKLVLNR